MTSHNNRHVWVVHGENGGQIACTFSEGAARQQAAGARRPGSMTVADNVASVCEDRDEWQARATQAEARCAELEEFARYVAEYDEYRDDHEDPNAIQGRIEASARAPLAKPGGEVKPVCKVCGDAHRMPNSGWMCVHCPTPCQECRAGGNGPFCAVTPCACACHGTGTRPEVKP